VTERPWLIDGRPLLGHSGVRGIGTYLRELLLAWADLGAASRVVLLRDLGGSSSGAADFDVGAGPGIPVLKRRIQPIADPFLVSLALRRVMPALYHGVEWAQPIAPRGVPVVLTIHDLIPFVFPDLYPWIRRERLLALRLARRADAVIVPSRATAADVQRLAHVDPARIHVIPHGVSTRFTPATARRGAQVRARFGIGDGPYLLSTGTLDERKRRNELAEVVARVRRQVDVRLVIAGDQGVYAAPVAAAIHHHGLSGATTLAGFVEAEDLATLYSGAAALVFTSAYEGFGLPILEALASGTRAVCFDNSSLPEVAGDAAVVVADGDVGGMADAVMAVLTESESERAEQVARGLAHAAHYTWERSARAHLDVYAAVERS
jgi:glycosyltransferase involved in cell wall biosynthesis